uniref:Uncharacterized protein n=1 Tax=Arundo donax TaxID=35708 RepID=A0A0A9B232_ARUDO
MEGYGLQHVSGAGQHVLQLVPHVPARRLVRGGRQLLHQRWDPPRLLGHWCSVSFLVKCSLPAMGGSTGWAATDPTQIPDPTSFGPNRPLLGSLHCSPVHRLSSVLPRPSQHLLDPARNPRRRRGD